LNAPVAVPGPVPAAAKGRVEGAKLGFLKKAEIILGAVCIFVIFAIICTNIVARYFFSAPLVWAEELSNFLFIWAAFLASAHLLAKGSHLRIDIFVDRFGRRMRLIVEIFNLAVIALVAGAYIYPCVLLLGDLSTTAAMKIPEAIPCGILPLTMILYVLHAAERIAGALRDLRAPDTPKEEPSS